MKCSDCGAEVIIDEDTYDVDVGGPSEYWGSVKHVSEIETYTKCCHADVVES